MKRQSILVLAAIVVAGLATTSNAELIDRGSGLIYDDDFDITWLQDADYASTSGYDSDGHITWYEAMTWADGLEYGGYDDWRLPTAYNFDGSGPSSFYNVTGSEMGHLFYVELGNTAAVPITNTGPFVNLSTVQGQSGYWSGTKYAPVPHNAWDFYFYYGSQSSNHKLTTYHAWAVRDGDVAPAPLIANAGGPYFLDIGDPPIMLGGSVVGGYNQAAWDLNLDGLFDDAFVLNPLISSTMLTSWGFSPGMTWDIGLQVTDLYGNVDVSTTQLTLTPPTLRCYSGQSRLDIFRLATP